MSESPERPTNEAGEKEDASQSAEQLETRDDSTEAENEAAENTPDSRAQRMLIGSQRDAAAKLATKKRDWYVPGQEKEPGQAEQEDNHTPDKQTQVEEIEAGEAIVEEIGPASAAAFDVDEIMPAVEDAARHFPPPKITDKLSPELEEELEEALGDASIDELIADSDSISKQPLFEPESRHVGRVLAVERGNVFVELGAREQGIVPLKLFDETPEVGAELNVIVTRFNHADGVYDILVPNASADVSDWSDLSEGMLVTAVVTGHNAGGLECEVNKIRGFIPVSHIALYRVENLEEFVGQKFICLVTEADQRRRNLVLSRRAVLEKENEDARKELLASLEPGQVRDGVVRKIMDFGAFVDLGGGDGLIHVSQLSWGRVGHPSEVLTEGQAVKVKILKMDEGGNRISLGYRDMIESPWTDVANKYPVGSLAQGKVSKLMEFGAFVELEPGVDGLVHISELSHKRVWRTSDVVSEGLEVEVVIKSVDEKAQRIGLSLKDARPPVKTEGKKEESEEPAEPAEQKASTQPPKQLKGGLAGPAGGEKFGLNW